MSYFLAAQSKNSPKRVCVDLFSPRHVLRLVLSNHDGVIEFQSPKTDWDDLENDFSVYYSIIGRPSIPVRKIVGLLLLKHIYRGVVEVSQEISGIKALEGESSVLAWREQSLARLGRFLASL